MQLDNKKIKIFNLDEKKIYEWKNDTVDLADLLMLNHDCSKAKIVYIEISKINSGLIKWDLKNVKEIEFEIKNDLEFDGYKVDIYRCNFIDDGIYCKKPFRWIIKITVDYGI